MISVIDSYYSQVVAQMANVDNTQLFGGIAQARDWPLSPVVEGSLYLLVLSMTPVGGTPAQAQYEYQCQWTWLLIGTDIGAAQQAQNRGDRYRQALKVAANLRQANFPQYCQKQSYAVDSQGAVSAAGVGTSYPLTDYEAIWWSRLRFLPRLDSDKSGVLYGAASVSVFGYDDVLPALAA